MQKADYSRDGGRSLNHVAVNETVMRLDRHHYWLFAAVDPGSNEFLYVKLFPARNRVTTTQFFRELQDGPDPVDAMFVVDKS